jgi:hypothetical protein
LLAWISRSNIEWGARLWRLIRGRPLVRYAGYLVIAAVAIYSNAIQLAIVGFFLLFQVTLQVPDTPSYVPIIFVITAAVLLIADRAWPERSTIPTAYPHDEHLLRQIRDLLNPNLDNFLRSYAFGNGSFPYDILSPLDGMRAMEGSRFDFIDPIISDAWRKVREANAKFMHEVSVRTYPTWRDASRGTPYHDNENTDWHTPETTAKLKILNDAANALVAELDAFDALARRQIPNVV